MTVRDWLTIGVCVATLANVWVLFLLRRLLKTVDTHGDDIAKLNQRLPLYVLRDSHDVANAELAAQMDRMRREAQEREARILDAIERASVSQTQETRILRGELSSVHQRIDRLRDQPRRS